MNLSVSSSTIDLDDQILLFLLSIISLCFWLTDVVHRAYRLFALVLDDEIHVLVATFLETGKTFVVEELVIILHGLLLNLTIFV